MYFQTRQPSVITSRQREEILNNTIIYALVVYIILLLLQKKKWIKIRAPFEQFKKSNFYQPKSILGQSIKSVGLVAGFEDFKADICLAKIGIY